SVRSLGQVSADDRKLSVFITLFETFIIQVAECRVRAAERALHLALHEFKKDLSFVPAVLSNKSFEVADDISILECFEIQVEHLVFDVTGAVAERNHRRSDSSCRSARNVLYLIQYSLLVEHF